MRVTQLIQKAKLAGLKVLRGEQNSTIIRNRSVGIIIYEDGAAMREDVTENMEKVMTIEAAAVVLGFK
jgi:hypothetical protein